MRARKGSIWGCVLVVAALLLPQGSATLAAARPQATCTRPTVTTLRPASVTSVSAVLRGQVDACRASGLKAWFQVIKPPRPATAMVTIPSDTLQHGISYKLTRLGAQQSVSYRVMAKFGPTILRGQIVTFSTSPPARLRVSAPADVTAGQTFKVTATGLNAQGGSVGDVTAHTKFTLSPDGSCTGSSCRATVAGAHTLHAADGPATGSAPVAVAAGPLDHLRLSPATATVCPQLAPFHADVSCATSYSQTYSAEGLDAYGNDLGDLTADTTFSISTPGSCTGTSCSVGDSTSAETVTGTDGAAQGTATLTGSDPVTMTCEGENYDVNGDMSDGCEQAQPSPGHTTQGTALNEGSKTCTDGTSQLNLTGQSLLSDSRVHANPAVSGFDTSVGSAPFWITEFASGGTFCTNDYSLTFTTSGGGSTACYKATITTDKLQNSTGLLTGSDTQTISHGSGAYSDGTTITIEIQKVCNLPIQEAVSWQLSWHL